MPHVLPIELLAFAHELADAAGEIARANFRKQVPVETKADMSPVTEIDKAIEKKLREMLRKRYPSHGVFGEEFEADNVDAECVWVIDPIDGTKSYITGRPLFGTLIALLWDGVPQLGVIDHPALMERWIGAAGYPTTFNGRVVRSRACASAARASVLTSSPDYYKGRDAETLSRLKSCTWLTMYGTECMSYGLVASGHADVAVEAGMDPFDYLAAVAVIEGAGGKITDWQGQPLGLRSGDKVLATGDPSLHRELLGILVPETGA
jgi:inositol-phosphate phosphatase / L-galactose 1-phosphate phosphatase / histidinol-phosphatase